MRLGKKSLIVILSIVFATFFVGSGVAGAQDSDPSGAYVGEKPEVLSETLELGQPEVQSADLAFTGSNTTDLVAIGAAAIVLGGGLLLVRRRVVAA
jgi:LPXTG-motif cell wall-anchored protein